MPTLGKTVALLTILTILLGANFSIQSVVAAEPNDQEVLKLNEETLYFLTTLLSNVFPVENVTSVDKELDSVVQAMMTSITAENLAATRSTIAQLTALFAVPKDELPIGICDRTPEVQKVLLKAMDLESCRVITGEDLAEIRGGSVHRYSTVEVPEVTRDDGSVHTLAHTKTVPDPEGDIYDIKALVIMGLYALSLQPGDFAGLSSLQKIFLMDVAHVPGDFFEETAAESLTITMPSSVTQIEPHMLRQTKPTFKDVVLLTPGVRVWPEELFWGMNNLETLNITKNVALRWPKLPDLAKLNELELHSDTVFLPLDAFGGASNLETVTLNMPRLLEVPPDLFAGLGMVKSVNLQWPQVQTIPAGLFEGMQSVEEIRLDAPLAQGMSRDLFATLPKLQFLSTTSNFPFLHLRLHPDSPLWRGVP